MNISSTMKLHDYCLLHRSDLESPNRGTLAKLAGGAATALQIKVPVSAMRDMFDDVTCQPWMDLAPIVPQHLQLCPDSDVELVHVYRGKDD